MRTPYKWTYLLIILGLILPFQNCGPTLNSASNSEFTTPSTETPSTDPGEDVLVNCDELECRYVRSEATGTGSGLDWTNAHSALPNTLTRGTIYFIADGNYSGYTFDDNVEGTKYITVKKATIANHGTNMGWLNDYGDEQATFRVGSGNLFDFRTHYLVIDGSVRDEAQWSNGSAYGFVFTVDNPDRAKIFNMSWEFPNDTWNGASHVVIQKVFASFPNVCYQDECYLNNIILLLNGVDVTLRNSYLANTSWHAALRIDSVNGLSVENNYFHNIYKKELISDQCCSTNVKFRNNYIQNVAGTAAIASYGSKDWEISNNVFWSPDTRYSFSDGIITTWTGKDQSMDNVKIFGNTFYQMRGATRIGSDGGSGNEVRNNLFLGFSPGITTTTFQASHNITNGSINLVQNADQGDFHLRAPTSAGMILNTPFSILDLDRRMRGKGLDSIWDMGAYEY